MIKFFAARITMPDGVSWVAKIALFKDTPQETIAWLNGHGALYELSTTGQANDAAEERRKANL